MPKVGECGDELVLKRLLPVQGHKQRDPGCGHRQHQNEADCSRSECDSAADQYVAQHRCTMFPFDIVSPDLHHQSFIFFTGVGIVGYSLLHSSLVSPGPNIRITALMV